MILTAVRTTDIEVPCRQQVEQHLVELFNALSKLNIDIRCVNVALHFGNLDGTPKGRTILPYMETQLTTQIKHCITYFPKIGQ